MSFDLICNEPHIQFSFETVFEEADHVCKCNVWCWIKQTANNVAYCSSCGRLTDLQ